jgi:hypothetical protein
MQSSVYEPALRKRALAAQLRAHAAETSVELFRHKFESAASELEEQAVNAESRALFREQPRLAS